MYTSRTRFATDIVTEFAAPARPSNKVVVFASGMPTMPGMKSQLATFLNKRGYWLFAPRYRGTWESGGWFLDHDPTDDIRDVIEGFTSPFQILPDGELVQVERPEIYLVGSSFGGPAAIALSAHPMVQKVVAVSSVVDWDQLGSDEPMDWLFEQFVPKVFGAGYRMKDQNDWKQFETSTFYNPVAYDTIDASKILMIHSEDDTVVPYQSVAAFSERHRIPLITLKGKGHAGTSDMITWRVWRRVKRHFLSV